MNKQDKKPRVWRATDARWKAVKVYCAQNCATIQDLIDEAMVDVAKKKGFRLP